MNQRYVIKKMEEKTLDFLELENGDDLGFLESVERVVISILNMRGHDDFTIIKINNWFDQKWLKFSGNTLVKFDMGGRDYPVHI